MQVPVSPALTRSRTAKSLRLLAFGREAAPAALACQSWRASLPRPDPVQGGEFEAQRSRVALLRQVM
jgi:hypothetical protein